MKKLIYFCGAIILIFSFSAYGFTENIQQQFGLPDSGDFSLGYGAHILKTNDNEQEMFYFLRFKPKFKIKKAEIGLDIDLNFNNKSKLRKEDWDSTKDILNKIEYIKFGEPEKDKFFFRVGFLDGITFGSGMLVSRYSNKITFPEESRKNGLDIGFAYSQDDVFRIMVNDINSPDLYAFRLTIKPMDFVDVGFNYVLDTDADGDGPLDDNLNAISLSASTPIFKNYADSLFIYQEISKIIKYGFGFSTGLKADVKNFRFKWEFRNFDSDFIPDYFDRFYEIDKRKKYEQLNKLADIGGKTSSIVGEIGYSLLKTIFLSTSYEKFFNNELRPKFHAELLLKENIIDFLEAAVTYDNKDADLSNMTTNDANTALIAELRAKVDKRVNIIYEYKTIRDEFNERQTTTSLETRIKF